MTLFVVAFAPIRNLFLLVDLSAIRFYVRGILVRDVQDLAFLRHLYVRELRGTYPAIVCTRRRRVWFSSVYCLLK